ncbi:MAG TPA: STAS-like domain-containing protein, partial [Candidatus Kapabacteria bacterium]|nr:STAS-like domain-containing protein [Candidatus Kapabacteria bacterium]
DMLLRTDTTRTVTEVFDRFASGDEDYVFSTTHVPVSLAEQGTGQLVSRSQAKRLLARFENFKEVCLDFKGVETIGQAFADEIFRVFKNAHPDINIIDINTSEEVGKMIRRAKAARERG